MPVGGSAVVFVSVGYTQLSMYFTSPAIAKCLAFSPVLILSDSDSDLDSKHGAIRYDTMRVAVNQPACNCRKMTVRSPNDVPVSSLLRLSKFLRGSHCGRISSFGRESPWRSEYSLRIIIDSRYSNMGKLLSMAVFVTGRLVGTTVASSKCLPPTKTP